MGEREKKGRTSAMLFRNAQLTAKSRGGTMSGAAELDFVRKRSRAADKPRGETGDYAGRAMINRVRKQGEENVNSPRRGGSA